jgi:hypothetical protein
MHLAVPALCLYFFVTWWQRGVRSPAAFVALLAVSMLYTPTIMLLAVALRRSQGRGAYKDMTVIVDESGVTQQTVLGSTHVAWSSLLVVQESIGLFLFYVTTHVAIPLPVRVVEHEGVLTDLRGTIANHASAGAKLAAG